MIKWVKLDESTRGNRKHFKLWSKNLTRGGQLED